MLFSTIRDRLTRGRPPVIPVLRLSGAIGALPGRRGGLSMAALAGPIEAAFSMKRARAVALAINSPGGSPVQSSLIAGRIRAMAQEKNLPVIAFVEDVAASGGYWLALAADEIFVDPSSIVGSIGVISAGFGFTGAIEKLGIERRSHTTGPDKGMLDPFRPEREEDRVILKEVQADIFEAFKAHVRERRSGKLAIDENELFSGRVWTGTRAVGHGLVDAIGDLRSIMRDRHGDRVRLVNVNPTRSWLQRKLGLQQAMSPDLIARSLIGTIEERMLYNRYGLR
ncbi:MAG: S49 family peptidase [Geminicoccaceae bacterium]|nr:S49 family peptidase [Geminicoccaceae bacterium]MCB9945032.1 S49 family peptidase [Geminicoccaceae bacterium]